MCETDGTIGVMMRRVTSGPQDGAHRGAAGMDFANGDRGLGEFSGEDAFETGHIARLEYAHDARLAVP